MPLLPCEQKSFLNLMLPFHEEMQICMLSFSVSGEQQSADRVLPAGLDGTFFRLFTKP
jgi:hypothetical protein